MTIPHYNSHPSSDGVAQTDVLAAGLEAGEVVAPNLLDAVDTNQGHDLAELGLENLERQVDTLGAVVLP
jgi:hypothetical protein